MQWTLFSAVILFTSNTIADVLVQPGYGQPQPIVQPASTYQQALNKDGQVQPDTYDPGYHLELHPVYAGAPQVPADPTVSYSLLQHQLTPYLSKSAQRRLNSGKLGDLGVMGLPLGVPAALSHQYLPLAVHSRYRRSCDDGSNSGGISEKPAVATKPSLAKNVPPVVDLQSPNGEATKNLDEKHVEVRQSNSKPTNTADTLLGLNPLRMYPAYPQYRSMAPVNSAFNSHQQIINEQTHPQTTSQVSSRASTQEQAPSQDHAATSIQNMPLRMNLLKLPQVMPLLQSAPQQPQQNGILQNSVRQEQRNAPDPRPASVSVQPMAGASYQQNVPQTSVAAGQTEVSDNKELVGTHHNLKIHVHKHGTIVLPRTASQSASSESYGCTCGNPDYVVYDDGTSSNLAYAPVNLQPMPQTFQLVPQTFQLPSVQGTSYSPNVNYVVVPSTYSNYVSNGWNYLPLASSFNSCSQNLNSVPTTMYQLISA